MKQWRARGPLAALVCALVAAASVGAAPARPRPKPSPTPSPARTASLGVILAVDGLAWSRLAEYRPWYVAGLKRLLDEGLVETECRYRHLNTETGPGHASLGTGEPPRLHGIVGNGWYEQGADGKSRNVYCTDQRVEGQPAEVPGPGNLRLPTLGDRLVERHPKSRVVSLSAKDRSAIFLAGRDRRHAAYWYDSSTGTFKTSLVYEPPAAVHDLVTTFNSASGGPALSARFGSRWSPLPTPSDAVARPTAVPARIYTDFQIPSVGLGWDHRLDWNERRYTSAFYGTPFMDTLLADLAIAVIESDAIGLGRGTTPDILAVSFSAHDAVAHSYGPESEEALDLLRRLDVELGRLLDALDRRVGRGKIALGLSADHGFSVIPEAARARDSAYRGGRLADGRRTMTDFVQRLNRALADDLCLPAGAAPLYGNHGWSIAYDRGAFPLSTVEGPCGPAGRPVGAAEIDRVLPAAVRRLFAEEIEGVWLVSDRERWPDADPKTEYVRNAFDAARSGDAFFIPRPGVLVHWDPARGSTHGTHHDYDTHVPLLFWGHTFEARESATPSTPYDLAPTLATRLGLDLKTTVGRVRR